eukprot:CAMPEP_0206241828 /NCGR_PEP_ID=MMETSP0047_2-20121206/16718_1 /ASSEMBLY_ACC=CAM_ASM_000192 /TAXON_ID=195065 /ORGANISM="Chroomonas mesostigmatica_cf, Strain CCMP1168" /LENGTH=195 /DNA_ID=CAMNT_0053666779 /DNA_START=156 /DNA_END=740 /DNA_ORIENTATION=+
MARATPRLCKTPNHLQEASLSVQTHTARARQNALEAHAVPLAELLSKISEQPQRSAPRTAHALEAYGVPLAKLLLKGPRAAAAQRTTAAHALEAYAVPLAKLLLKGVPGRERGEDVPPPHEGDGGAAVAHTLGGEHLGAFVAVRDALLRHLQALKHPLCELGVLSLHLANALGPIYNRGPSHFGLLWRFDHGPQR